MSTSILSRPTATSTSSPKPTTIPAIPDADPERCALLGPTALLVQGLMGVFVLASLIAKRQLERKKRPWRIWTFDVSKQLFGQGFVHASNVFISALVAHLSSDNPCSLYFLNVLVDTTLGVFIIYLSLHLYEHVLIKTLSLSPNFKSGLYGTPPRLLNWARQLVPYLSALITMKLCVVGLFAIFPGPFVRLGNWVLDWMSATSQVIFVMMIFPLVMNVLQFCLVDQILKDSSTLELGKALAGDDAYERLPTSARDEEEGHGDSADVDASSSLHNRRRSFGILYPHETTPIPSSPLLGADDKERTGYGSATPSPRNGPGISGFELPPGVLAGPKKRTRSALALARDSEDFEVRLVLGGAVEVGLPRGFRRNGIDQGKVVLRNAGGALLEIFKVSSGEGRADLSLQDLLLPSSDDRVVTTESTIIPSPFASQHVTTANILRARGDDSGEDVAILSDGTATSGKLVVKLTTPSAVGPASWFDATVGSVKIVDTHAWLSCQATDLEEQDL